MEQIIGSKKYQNGIQVSWLDSGTEKTDFFGFEELIDQKINSLDLLNNPRLYLMNPAGHRIESAAAGCRFGTKTCEDEILISRLLDAPRDLAWRVWTEPDLVMQWWGPRNFTAPSVKNDLRVGGRYLYCMRSPEGRDYWSTGVYREVQQPEKIVCTDSFADEHGNVVPPSYYGMSGIPEELLVTVTFGIQAGRTLLTLRHAGFPAGDAQDLARAGWNESLDKYSGILLKTAFGRARDGGQVQQGITKTG